ncbi:MAG: hypothetical protein AB9869_00595 [Verrucomicrobiia bacterium]
MSASVQLRSSRPMIPMELAMIILDCDEDQVLALVESGDLVFAWDIRTPRTRKREVRIWYLSLICQAEGIPQPLPEEKDVLFSLFPHDEPELRSPEVQRMLSISQGHVTRLIRSRAIRGTKGRPGPSGVAIVNRASLMDWLHQRRIT